MAVAQAEIAPRNIEENPQLQNFDIPPHLTKNAIREKQIALGKIFLPKLWNERGRIIEFRGTHIIESQKDLVENVEINFKPDEQGYDAMAYFVPEFVLDGVFVEFKSSPLGIQDYKQKIRDKLPPEKRNMDGVREHMTGNDIVLINCNDQKQSNEILNDSFYPQLRRIMCKRLTDSMQEHLSNLQTQVWPEV